MPAAALFSRLLARALVSVSPAWPYLPGRAGFHFQLAASISYWQPPALARAAGRQQPPLPGEELGWPGAAGGAVGGSSWGRFAPTSRGMRGNSFPNETSSPGSSPSLLRAPGQAGGRSLQPRWGERSDAGLLQLPPGTPWWRGLGAGVGGSPWILN